jgi:type IV secretion system protein VirD4
VQMIIDPDGKGLPDHWSREGSAFLTGMILDQLYAGRDKTLSGLEARLCDPGQPIDDTMQQIMRSEHDPSGSLGWTDSRGIPTRTHPIIARAMRSMLDKRCFTAPARNATFMHLLRQVGKETLSAATGKGLASA